MISDKIATVLIPTSGPILRERYPPSGKGRRRRGTGTLSGSPGHRQYWPGSSRSIHILLIDNQYILTVFIYFFLTKKQSGTFDKIDFLILQSNDPSFVRRTSSWDRKNKNESLMAASVPADKTNGAKDYFFQHP